MEATQEVFCDEACRMTSSDFLVLIVSGGPVGTTGGVALRTRLRRSPSLPPYSHASSPSSGTHAGETCTPRSCTILHEIVDEHSDLRPGGIVRDLDLRRPRYSATVAYVYRGGDLARRRPATRCGPVVRVRPGTSEANAAFDEVPTFRGSSKARNRFCVSQRLVRLAA